MSEEERLQLEQELLLTCSKAQAINKYIDELEESSKLSELWRDSQVENRQLKSALKEIREYINHEWFKRTQLGIVDKSFQEWQMIKLLEIIDKGIGEDNG